MNDNKRKKPVYDNTVAPGIDEEDAYGVEASKADIKEDESTTVKRFVYDEYDPSEK